LSPLRSVAVGRLLRFGAAASLLAVGLLASACSGGPRSDAAQPAGEPSQPAESRVAALASLEKRQDAACEGVGKTLFGCAIEDARGSMSPEEFAKLEPAQLEPEYMSRFLDECLENDMSPRQVSVFEGCLQDTRCEVFVPCLDGARPQPPAASGPDETS
jgi:hypothetical protein